MKTIIAALTASAVLASVPAIAADGPNKGEQELAKIIKGRVAGKPSDCIDTFGPDPRMRIIENTAIVYRRGDTVWVNRPDNPRVLDADNILVSERIGSQYCRLDRSYMIGRYDGIFAGPLFLGKFVPYRLPKADG